MDRRTRGRPKRVDTVASIPVTDKRGGITTPSVVDLTGTHITSGRTATRNSPGRLQQSSPPPVVRRSSRPRSSASTATVTIASTVVPPSPVKELKEPKSSPKARGNTNTVSTRAQSSNQSSPTTRTKVESSYSSSTVTTTEKTVEIRSSKTGLIEAELSKFTDFLRRSTSRPTISGFEANGRDTPTTNTEGESRYSRSVSHSIYDDDNYSKTGHSDSSKLLAEDDDEVEEENYKSFTAPAGQQVRSSSTMLLCRKLEVPQEFGGIYGVLALLLLVAPLVYYLQWCCNIGKTEKCVLKMPELSVLLDFGYLTKNYFPVKVVAAFITFQTGVFVLAAMPCGKIVRLAGVEYRFNALPMGVLLTLCVAIATYLNYPVVDFVLRHYLHFCLYGLLNAYIVAQWCYIRGDMLRLNERGSTSGVQQSQQNIYGKTGIHIIDYAQGRLLNPRWLDVVEFKQAFGRIALLTTLLYAECLLYKSIKFLPLVDAAPKAILNATDVEATATLFSTATLVAAWDWLQQFVAAVQYDPAALLTSSMLLLYVTDAVVFEHHLTSSFELQGEGFGCLLLLRYASAPYLLTAVARYFAERKLTINCQFAVYVPLLFLMAGLVLKRFSNALKYKYRLNPSNPIFHDMDSIHTFQNRRLLLGALWGRVRQPNYAGDILALVALALPLYLRFAWPPLLGLLCCVVLLLHRAVRVSTRNLSRYHSSWVRYCSQVRNYVLPKVY